MPLDLDVRDLSLVREIADTGSVTRASARLHLTQSALSHRLRAVESRLDAPLFLRVGKKMLLTPAGDRVLASARRVLEELARAEDEVKALGRKDSGVLRLCTQCYTGYHWLPPLLRVFHGKYPKVEIDITVDATYRPVEALLAGDVDLAVLTEGVKDARLQVRPLFDDEMLVIVSRKHAWAARAFVEIADLASEHLIAYRTDRKDSYVFKTILGPAGVEPARVSQVPLTEAILEMVKAGLGIAVMSRWAIEPALKSGRVRGVRLTRKGVTRRWSAATLASRPEPDWQSDFIALLRKGAPTRPTAS